MEKGIKESKELISAVALAGRLVWNYVKDGIQMDDFPALINELLKDEANKKVLQDGFDGAAEVFGEIADLSLSEGIELGMHLVSEVFKKQP